MYFSLKFNVWLGWIDYRLGFKTCTKFHIKMKYMSLRKEYGSLELSLKIIYRERY